MTTAYNEQFSKNLNSEEFKTLHRLIQDRIDVHNTYSLNSRDVEAFTKNYVVEQMYRISMDLRNLQQAQMSVDQTTDEPKAIADQSTAGKLVKRATPGNIGNKYQSIEDNHVGKDVIGISAVGLKSFFALTQFVNTVLNTGSETEVQELFNKPLLFDGKEYYTIANANYSTQNTSTDNLEENLKILEKLKAGDARDAALTISALLSLATDFH